LDPDALHDMRVASRRLREALEIFGFCFPQKLFDRYYRRVRRVTRALGEVRNADVAMIFFQKLSASTDDILVQVALEDLLRRLARSRRSARGRLLTGLHEARLAHLPAELANVFTRTENMPVRYQRGPKRSVVLARRQLLQRVRAFFSARMAVTAEDDEANLHKVRIAVKKLRYAVEVFDYAVGEDVVSHLGELKRLQDTLGELHDHDVFAGMVRKRLAKLQTQPQATLLCNGLHAVLHMILERRREYYYEYQKLSAGCKLQDWRRRFVPPANTLQQRSQMMQDAPPAGISPPV